METGTATRWRAATPAGAGENGHQDSRRPASASKPRPGELAATDKAATPTQLVGELDPAAGPALRLLTRAAPARRRRPTAPRAARASARPPRPSHARRASPAPPPGRRPSGLVAQQPVEPGGHRRRRHARQADRGTLRLVEQRQRGHRDRHPGRSALRSAALEPSLERWYGSTIRSQSAQQCERVRRVRGSRCANSTASSSAGGRGRGRAAISSGRFGSGYSALTRRSRRRGQRRRRMRQRLDQLAGCPCRAGRSRSSRSAPGRLGAAAAAGGAVRGGSGAPCGIRVTLSPRPSPARRFRSAACARPRATHAAGRRPRRPRSAPAASSRSRVLCSATQTTRPCSAGCAEQRRPDAPAASGRAGAAAPRRAGRRAGSRRSGRGRLASSPSCQAGTTRRAGPARPARSVRSSANTMAGRLGMASSRWREYSAMPQRTSQVVIQATERRRRRGRQQQVGGERARRASGQVAPAGDGLAGASQAASGCDRLAQRGDQVVAVRFGPERERRRQVARRGRER